MMSNIQPDLPVSPNRCIVIARFGWRATKVQMTWTRVKIAEWIAREVGSRLVTQTLRRSAITLDHRSGSLAYGA